MKAGFGCCSEASCEVGHKACIRRDADEVVSKQVRWRHAALCIAYLRLFCCIDAAGWGILGRAGHLVRGADLGWRIGLFQAVSESKSTCTVKATIPLHSQLHSQCIPCKTMQNPGRFLAVFSHGLRGLLDVNSRSYSWHWGHWVGREGVLHTASLAFWLPVWCSAKVVCVFKIMILNDDG